VSNGVVTGPGIDPVWDELVFGLSFRIRRIYHAALSSKPEIHPARHVYADWRKIKANITDEVKEKFPAFPSFRQTFLLNAVRVLTHESMTVPCPCLIVA
jgi:hypothetical protein